MPVEPIRIEQNSDSSLQLLAAQRQLYIEAKQHSNWVFALAVLSAVVIPCVLYFAPEADDWWGLLGIAVFALNELLKSNEKAKREMASLVQEQLDTQLFGIPWNDSLAGEPVSPELIIAADARFSGKRDKLRDWYSAAKSELPHKLTVLFCQRENLVWEYRLRQGYIRFLSVVFFLVLVSIIVLGLFFDVLLYTFLVKYLAPVLPLLWLIGNSWLSHRKTSEALQQKEKGITSLLLTNGLIPEAVSVEALRFYQDAVLKNRQTGPMVQDWFYHLVEKRIANELNQAKDLIIKKLTDKGGGME